MAGLALADVDLDVHDVIHVVGKGSRPRAVPFGSRTGTALDRYLRERAKHKLAKLPNLWIGARGGPMTESGIAQMLRRRGAEAGVSIYTRIDFGTRSRICGRPAAVTKTP